MAKQKLGIGDKSFLELLRAVPRKVWILLTVSLLIAGLMIFLTYRFIFTEAIDFRKAFFGEPGDTLWIIPIIIFVTVRSLIYAMGAWVYLRKLQFDKKVPFYKFIPLAMQMTFIQVITPFTFGSQPWAAMYLKRKGYKLREVVPAVMARDTIYQAALVLVPLVYSPYALHEGLLNVGATDKSLFITLLSVGMTVDFVTGLAVFLMGYSAGFQRFVLRVVHFIRMKISRNPRIEDKTLEWLKKQQAFHANYIMNLKDWNSGLIVCAMMLLHVLAAGFLFSFTADYTGTVDKDFYFSSALSAASYSASGIVPIPGGFGEQELLLRIGTQYSFTTNGVYNVGAQANAINAWRFWASFVPGAIGLVFILFAAPSLIAGRKKWFNRPLEAASIVGREPDFKEPTVGE